jgi:X-Pro dipeptidyl-peptidase
MKPVKRIKTIFEKVYIETPLDTDKDGRLDLIVAWITRPLNTLEGDEKLPAVFVANPYLMTCNEDMYNLHDVDIPLEIFDEDGKQESNFSKRDEIDIIAKNAEKVKKTGEAKSAITEERPVFDAVSPLYDYLAQKGYAIVFCGGLGTLGSDGMTMTGSQEEVIAFRTVIDWLCGRARAFTNRTDGIEIKASWCNGNVAMGSKSYLGTLQYAIASTGVDGLKAIIPEAAICNWYEYYRTNGLCVCPQEWQGDDCDLLALYCMSRAKEKEDWDKVENQYMKLMDKYIELEDRSSGNYNSFWHERNYLTEPNKYQTPTFIIHGLNDWNVKTTQCAKAYEFLQKHNIDRKILLHQGGHTYVYDLKGSNALESVEKWLAYYLKNEDNDIKSEPRVSVQSNLDQIEWFSSDEWPPKEAKYYSFPVGNESIKIVDDISKTVFRKEDNNLVEWRDELVLSTDDNFKYLKLWNPWEDGIADEKFRISGTSHLSFTASINRGTAILSAMLVDFGLSRRLTEEEIHPEKDEDLFEFALEKEPSKYRIITRGWLNAQNYASISNKKHIEPGQDYNFSFDMVPTDYSLKKGHKLGLIIYGTDAEFTVRQNIRTEILIKADSIKIDIPIIV